MEKEQILSTINERLESAGIKTESFQRTFSEYVDLNLPDEGVEPDDAYFEKHVKMLTSISGQFNHDIAKMVEDLKKNPNPSPKQPKTEPNDDRYSALEKKFNEMLEKQNKLVEQLNEKESKATQQQILAKVKDEMKKQGATDGYVLSKTLQGVTFDTKKSIADIAKEMLNAYDSEFTACRGKGAAPRNGGQSTGGAGKTLADGFFARKSKKEGWDKAPQK